MIYQRIQYFLKTTESGSFTKAAQDLFISPQALTKQIAKLEDELGGKLFERSSKGISLTELGRFAKDRFTNAQAVFDQAVEQVQARAKEEKPVIRIGFFSALPKDRIITSVVSFMIVHYPDHSIDFELLEMDEARKKLLSGQIDLLFTNIQEDQKWEGCHGYSFHTEEAKVIVSDNHPWHTKESITVEDLKSEIFLKLESDEYRKAPQPGQGFYNTIPCKRVWRVSNIVTMMELLKQGNAFAVVPMLLTDAAQTQIRAFEYPGKKYLFHAALVAKSDNAALAIKIAEEFELEDLGML